MKNIYVYADEGVEPNSFLHLKSAFAQYKPEIHLIEISANNVKKGSWVRDARAFIIPGGADLPYGRKLNGQGNGVIKSYVQEGGKFLGICAGGYYASNHIRFDQGPHKKPIEGPRELSFFPGTCKGPILGQYTPRSYAGAVIAQLHSTCFHQDTFSYYHGGGYFVDAETQPSTKVLYKYTDSNVVGEAAVIFCSVGKGQAILTGVHPEYCPDLLEDERVKKSDGHENLKDLIPLLKSARPSVFQMILKKFGLL